MELRQLHSFRTVVREGSFTAAAKALHMTQPAVSLHVKALEEEAGSRLLERDARRLQLTAAGRVMLETAEAVLGRAEDGLRRIREMEEPERGTLTLACGDTIALAVLPPILTAFRRLRPLAEVVIHNHGSKRILDLVLRREADLGLVTRPPWLDPALWARALLKEHFLLALPPRHPLGDAKELDLTRLDGEPAVLLARPSETRALVDRGFDDAGIRPTVVMESGNLEVVKAYVADGLGFSVLPEMAVREDDHDRLRLRPLGDAFPARTVSVVRREDRVPSLLATDVLKLLAERYRPAS